MSFERSRLSWRGDPGLGVDPTKARPAQCGHDRDRESQRHERRSQHQRAEREGSDRRTDRPRGHEPGLEQAKTRPRAVSSTARCSSVRPDTSMNAYPTPAIARKTITGTAADTTAIATSGIPHSATPNAKPGVSRLLPTSETVAAPAITRRHRRPRPAGPLPTAQTKLIDREPHDQLDRAPHVIACSPSRSRTSAAPGFRATWRKPSSRSAGSEGPAPSVGLDERTRS
jgi:hypothetical protein